MKKILSLGVAAAVVSMTAVAASATYAPVILEEAVAGEVITVEVVANGITTTDIGFSVVASENLTLVGDPAVTTEGMGQFNAANGKFGWIGLNAPADGTVMLTLTYTVDAAADEEVSVALVADEVYAADVDANAAVKVVIDGAESSVIDVTTTEESSTDTVDTVDTETGIEIETSTEAPAESSTEDTSDNQVDTGVALAVVPAVLAGAAIVVAKKRK